MHCVIFKTLAWTMLYPQFVIFHLLWEPYYPISNIRHANYYVTYLSEVRAGEVSTVFRTFRVSSVSESSLMFVPVFNLTTRTLNFGFSFI